MKREIKFSLVFRDMWQSAGKYVPRVDQLVRVAPAIIEMGCFARVETNGGGFEQVNLLFGENPNKAVREWTKPFKEAGIQTHMLDRALIGMGTSLDRVPMERIEACLAENRYPRLEALLADIALGNRMPMQVAALLAQQVAKPKRGEGRKAPLATVAREPILISGSQRGVISFAQCCMPIPRDEIMGYHTAGKGVVVHRMDCPNVADYRKSPERWVPVAWDRQVSGDFNVAIRIEVENRPGVLAQVAAAVAQAESNIDKVEYLERDSNIAVLRFGIDVTDGRHLAEVIRGVRRLQVVQDVQRC